MSDPDPLGDQPGPRSPRCPPPEPQLSEATRSGLVLKDIHSGYGKQEILRGVTLCSRPGDLLAVIGPNGSGKSTLLKVIAGLLPAWKGSVGLDGEDLASLPAHRRVRLGLAYLLQGGQIFPSMSVRDNLDISIASLPAGERQGACEKVLWILPVLKPLWQRRAGLLSGGQRQALAVAMVLVRRPRAALFDEPFAGLARPLVENVQEALRQLSGGGSAVILVEQDVVAALELATRAVALDGGRVVREATEPLRWLTDGTLEAVLSLGPTVHGSEGGRGSSGSGCHESEA